MVSSSRKLNSINETFERARQLQSEGKVAESIAEYRAVLALDKKYLAAWHQLAQLLEQQGKWDEAAEHYRKSIELDPQPPFWVRRHFGFSLYQQGLFEEAIVAYQKAIAVQPEEATIHSLLGQAFGRNGDVEGAIESYQRAIELSPELPIWVYLNLGDGLSQIDRLDEAISAYEKALVLAPENAGIVRLLEVATKRKEANEQDKCHRAKQLQREGLLEEALAEFRAVLAVDGSNLVALHQVAQICETQGKWDEAVEGYRRAIEVDADSPFWVYRHLGFLLNNEERYDEAIIEYNKAISLQPDDASAYTLLGQAQEKSGDIEASISCYKKAISIEKEVPTWVYLSLGKSLNKYDKIDEAISICEAALEIDSTNVEISDFLKTLNNKKIELEDACKDLIAPKKKDLFEMISMAIQKPGLNLFHDFNNKIWDLYSQLNHPKLVLEYGCWLTPSLIYIEGSVEDCWILGETKSFLIGEDTCEIVDANFFQTSHNQFAAIALCRRNVYTEHFKAYYLIPFSGKTPIFIEKGIHEKAYGLSIVNRLKSKPEYQKHLIRESISRAIIKFMPADLRHQARELLYKLQNFLPVSPLTFSDVSLPFKFFIEQVIPIHYEGVFISGWLHDPHNMLQEIEVISALGFSISIPRIQIYRLSRPDVSQYLQNNPYGNNEGKLGFCAYALISPEIRSQLEDIAELHSFRFKAKLKGQIDIEVIPDVKHLDVFAARQFIVQIAPVEEVNEWMLNNCIAPAAAKLQQLCIKQVAVKEVVTVNTTIHNPLISIIIPLYKQIDFLKVQIATMANDSSIKNRCEIIYVLDSPEQEREVKELLLDYCLLYELPVRLVIMERNSGYAAANNIGASYAKGEYLILLNSDVFPKSKGWAVKMAEFYAALPEIGTLAPKLLYEDESIQHAGMYFDRTKFPFWLTLHYYKGFPNSYELAQNSRSVPAVTGACLMIRKSLYEQVGGLSTDYIIGDFEDSDLCFKCTNLGYKSWYVANIELYHLERQSMPLSNIYSGSLAWRCNANLHESRWKKTIKKLMKINSDHTKT
jgi:tetratricopeptide (TPR) repeat protein/GT2 family glycosyltransferase